MGDFEGELYKGNGDSAALYDVCEWWLHWYPEDVFVTEPKDIIEIRDRMKAILERRDKALEDYKRMMAEGSECM